MASVSCSVDTAICMQAAAARQVRMSLQSKAGRAPPPSPHSPMVPPDCSIACLPLTAHTHPAPTAVCLAYSCLCRVLLLTLFCDCMLIHTFSTIVSAYSHLFLSVHTCHTGSYVSTSLYICPYQFSSYLPLPTHTCSHVTFLHVHACSQQDIIGHSYLCPCTPVHTCTNYAYLSFSTPDHACCECTY